MLIREMATVEANGTTPEDEMEWDAHEQFQNRRYFKTRGTRAL